MEMASLDRNLSKKHGSAHGRLNTSDASPEPVKQYLQCEPIKQHLMLQLSDHQVPVAKQVPHGCAHRMTDQPACPTRLRAQFVRNNGQDQMLQQPALVLSSALRGHVILLESI